MDDSDQLSECVWTTLTFYTVDAPKRHVQSVAYILVLLFILVECTEFVFFFLCAFLLQLLHHHRMIGD
jgi:hypothetical protein